MSRRLSFLLCVATAVAFVFVDFFVRASTASWSQSVVLQWLVLVSPVSYLLVSCLVVVRWSHLAKLIGPSARRVLAVALCAYAMATIAQVFLQKQDVGSAVYSPVWPSFVSGVPLAGLMLAVFFRKDRPPQASAMIALVSVLWVACPIAIDAMFAMQGGYRGHVQLQDIAVIGTVYDFLIRFVAIAFFGFVVVVPLSGILGLLAVIRSDERLQSAAVGLALLAFGMQLSNWGGFIWD